MCLRSVVPVVVAFSLLLATRISQAQESIVPDTLDWTLYYPLEVGNSWEWSTFIQFSYFAKDVAAIVGDTVIDGRNYFIQERLKSEQDDNAGIDRFSMWREYLRYDTLSSSVIAWNDAQSLEYAYTCDLSTDFGARAYCLNRDSAFTTGSYSPNHLIVIGNDSIPSGGSKLIYDFGGGINYYHGVGRKPTPGDGGSGSIAFKYVVIGPNSYGTSYTLAGTERDITNPIRFSAFPNPTTDQIYFHIPVMFTPIDLDIIDMTGKRRKLVRCNTTICSFETRDLSSGLYFIRSTERSQRRLQSQFVVRK